eukprot:TRINITY_DN6479_c0_g1_i3.p1 TRINITY_DN6479_c0_g1~~TRINITY_DN6479_c0_g1_i3.p1  ORF type:complete len:1253 (+),score=219.48 TRINITY_DN6479_c0_g1_i3:277-4035(+)
MQTLEGHVAHVTAVKWANDSLSQVSSSRTAPWRIASADTIGVIYVWDVKEAKVLVALYDTPSAQKAILQMEWHPMWANHILSLQCPSQLVLWNVATKSKVWRCEVGENCFDFGFNPFNPVDLLLIADAGWIYVAKNSSSTMAPSAIERKYRVQSTSSSPSAEDLRKQNKSTITRLAAHVNQLTFGSGPSTSSLTNFPSPRSKIIKTGDLTQMIYSSAHRNIVYFILSREVIIFDSSISQAIGGFTIDRQRSNITKGLLSPTYGDCIVLLHDEGVLTYWKSTFRAPFQYEYVCCSDYLKFGKIGLPRSATHGLNPLVNVVGNPLVESSFACLSNDGRLFFMDVGNTPTLPFAYSIPTQFRSVASEQVLSLVSRLSTFEKPQATAAPKFFLSAEYQLVTSSIKCIHVNYTHSIGQSKVAIGSKYGSILVVNLVKNELEREYNLFDEPILSIAWISSHMLLSHVVIEVDKKYRNLLFSLDVRSGRVRYLRQHTVPETSPIREVKVSGSKRHALVYLKDRPLEVWDVQAFELVTTLNTITHVYGMEWMTSTHDSPNFHHHHPHHQQASSFTEVTPSFKERFLLVTPNGFVFFALEHNNVHHLRLLLESSPTKNVVLSWKDNLLVTADDTLLMVWDVMKGHRLNTVSLQGSIRKIKFSPSQRLNYLLLWQENELMILLADNLATLETMQWPKELSILDADWGWDDHPIAAFSDGSTRIFDARLKANSHIRSAWLSYPIVNPIVLPVKQALGLKAFLQHGCKKFESNAAVSQSLFDGLVSLVDGRFLELISSPLLSPVDRCVLVAAYFGDLSEVRFWMLVHYYVNRTIQESSPIPSSYTLASGSASSLSASPAYVNQVIPETTSLDGNGLAGSFQYLRDSETIFLEELNLARLRGMRRLNYAQTKQSIHQHLLLGQFDRSIQMLMETSSQNDAFLCDMLKACVVSAAISPDIFENTIRAVATNLIANKYLDEGVQLLALLGKSGEACRYLEMSERWEEAASLAKVSRAEKQAGEVFRRWARNMWQSEPERAATLLVAASEYYEAIAVLLSSKAYDRAAQLALVALSCGKIQQDDETPLSETIVNVIGPMVSATTGIDINTHGSLIKCVMASYGGYLSKVEYLDAAHHYINLAGCLGVQIKRLSIGPSHSRDAQNEHHHLLHGRSEDEDEIFEDSLAEGHDGESDRGNTADEDGDGETNTESFEEAVTPPYVDAEDHGTDAEPDLGIFAEAYHVRRRGSLVSSGTEDNTSPSLQRKQVH